MQQYASIYLLQNYSTRFGCPSHQSGVQRPVTAASGTGHSIRVTTFLQRGLIRPRWRKVVALTLWPVPEAAVTELGHAGGRLLLWHYDLYQKLQLYFDVLLMMGAIDTRNI